MKENVLVIVAHPDDETIGMGATIKRHSMMGDNIFVVSMTNGVGSRSKSSDKEVKGREIQAENASKVLGFKWIERYDFKDNSLDSYPLIKIIKSIEKVKSKIKPSLVYTHSGSDLNIDHRVISNSVFTAFRPQPNEICKEIRLFEISSATDFSHESIASIFNPNLFINIQKTWKYKALALEGYGKEIKNYPHTRSLEGLQNLAKVRGNQVGIFMAEAFQVARKIAH